MSNVAVETPAKRLRELAVPATALFLVLALLYTFSIGLRASRHASITGDEPFYVVTTQSLLDDRDLDLRNQYEYETYRSFFDHPDQLWRQAGPLPDGRLLSPHQPGLSVLILPGFAIDGLRGVQIELELLTALTFALTFILAALETKRVRLSFLVTALTGLSAPAFVYATEVYPEMPAALCVVSALLVLRLPKGSARCFALAAVLTAMAWLGLKYVPLGLAVAGFYAWRATGRERVCFAILGLASAAVYAWWHMATFGALTPYSSNLVYDGASTASVIESHVSLSDRTYRIWGLFVDRRFGIGRWAPIFLAVLPALPLLRRATPAGNITTVLIAVQIAIATFASVTMMGWWFPGRMLISVFPLFALALTVVAARLPRPALAVAAVAAGYSLLVTALLVQAAAAREVTLAVNPFEMASPPFRWAAPLFPQYTWWTTETILLNTIWLTVLASGFAIVAAWPYRHLAREFIVMRRPARIGENKYGHPRPSRRET